MANFFPSSPLTGAALMALLQNLFADVAGQVNPGTFRNIVGSNGGLEVWQRGTSIALAASTTAYTADRWYLATGATQASTVAQTTGLTNASQFCAKVQRNSGQAGTGQMYFAYPLDTDELVKMRGNKVIVQFTASTGANWSPTSGTLVCNLYVGTGSVGKRGGSAYSGETNPINFSNNITAGTGATAYTSSVSSAVATNITQAELQFTWTPTGSAGANDWFSVDDVTLQVVSSNLTAMVPIFERTDFQSDYTRCLRHYFKTFPYATAPAQSAGNTGTITATTVVAGANNSTYGFTYPVELRAIPGTVTFYNPAANNTNWRNLSLAADSGAASVGRSSPKNLAVNNAQVSGDQIGNVFIVHFSSDASI